MVALGPTTEFLRNVDQRWSPRGCPAGNFGMYLWIVLGETRMPSFTKSSLAIRSSPQMGFSCAILRISARNSREIRGRPGRHFQRQKRRQPARCQRMMVFGCTTTSASRQSNSCDNTVKLMRVSEQTEIYLHCHYRALAVLLRVLRPISGATTPVCTRVDPPSSAPTDQSSVRLLYSDSCQKPYARNSAYARPGADVSQPFI